MDQQQEQKKSGSVLNDIQGASSNLRIGRFLVAQGGKLLGGMGGPVLLTIGLIILLVFVVGFAGIPGGSGVPTPTPTIVPPGGGGTPPPGTTGTPSPQPSQPPISLTPSITIIPSISPSQDLRQDIIDRFGIAMNGGFDQPHLQWTWNKLQSVSNTRFVELTRGTTITAILGNGSEQTGCRTINLSQYQPEELFNVALIHELSHIIRNCNNRSLVQYANHLLVLNNEGPVTNYARTACTGGTNTESEDYAEMITYYLNPGADAQTAACAGRQSNPYLNNAHSLHYNLAKQILGDFP